MCLDAVTTPEGRWLKTGQTGYFDVTAVMSGGAAISNI